MSEQPDKEGSIKRCPRAREESGRKAKLPVPHAPHTWRAGIYYPVGHVDGYLAHCPGWPDPAEDMTVHALRRTAEVVVTMARQWHANDPADSRSGTTEGKMRRAGRRDTAVLAIAVALNTTEDKVQRMLEEGVI